jgi:hypothetical protein
MSDNDLISTFLESQRHNYERMIGEWDALPWYQKARINTANWVCAKRVRLGEIVAGREFNDDY